MQSGSDKAQKGTRQDRDSDDALLAFRAAVEHHAGGRTNIDDLRHPLRQFCAQARREQIAPEELLVRLKHTLDELPSRDGNDPTAKEEIRNRIVTLAIQIYYTDGERDGQ